MRLIEPSWLVSADMEHLRRDYREISKRILMGEKITPDITLRHSAKR
jgi:hypothetical protein